MNPFPHPVKKGTGIFSKRKMPVPFFPLEREGQDEGVARFEDELNLLRTSDLYRKLRVLEPGAAAEARFEGGPVLLFCGNDYLGLSRHPRVRAITKEAIDRYGVGAGAARLVSGNTPAHAALENKIAAFKKKERALVYATGYLANLGILTALAGPEDLIVLDKSCHASIVDGAKLSGARLRVFPHRHYERCESILENEASRARRRILVSESVFSMDGDLADLGALVRLKEKFDCLLVIDDAHGTGVLGREGRGAAEDLGLENKIDILMGTLSKALGGLGGFAAASEPLVDYLINRSRPFIFATALPPVLAEAASEALNIILEEPVLRERLWQNARAIHEGLLRLGFQPGPLQSPILPVMVGSEKEALRVSQELLREGIFVPAIRTPTVPKGRARLRITASALHEDAQIERLLQAIAIHFPPPKHGGPS